MAGRNLPSRGECQSRSVDRASPWRDRGDDPRSTGDTRTGCGAALPGYRCRLHEPGGNEVAAAAGLSAAEDGSGGGGTCGPWSRRGSRRAVANTGRVEIALLSLTSADEHPRV